MSRCLRSIKTAPKWSQHNKKYHQYSPISIETDTVLTTLWTPVQTNLRMPLHEFIQHPRVPKQFLWTAGWREAYRIYYMEGLEECGKSFRVVPCVHACSLGLVRFRPTRPGGSFPFPFPGRRLFPFPSSDHMLPFPLRAIFFLLIFQCFL